MQKRLQKQINYNSGIEWARKIVEVMKMQKKYCGTFSCFLSYIFLPALIILKFRSPYAIHQVQINEQILKNSVPEVEKIPQKIEMTDFQQHENVHIPMGKER